MCVVDASTSPRGKTRSESVNAHMVWREKFAALGEVFNADARYAKTVNMEE